MSADACHFSAALTGFRLGPEHSVAPAEQSSFAELQAAQSACLGLGDSCGGVTLSKHDAYELRIGSVPTPSPTGGAAWVKLCSSGSCELEESAWYWGAHLRTVPHLDDVQDC